MNLLVETKNEYTTHLVNTLTPAIYEGIQSIYKDAITSAEQNEVLRVFQKYLREIPKWNQLIIDKETERIINSVQGYEWVENLARAALKANLAVLMYNPTMKSQPKLDTSAYKNLKFCNYIHMIYVECARELWNNPYLFYHNYPPIDIKRNQREAISVIKDCIRESIRKLLPIKSILTFYLADDEIPISNNLDDGLQQDVLNKPLLEQDLGKTQFEKETPQNTNLLVPYVEAKTESASLGTKILNIYNDNNSEKSSVINQSDYRHAKPTNNDSMVSELNKSTIKTELLSSDFVKSTKQFDKSEIISSPVNGEEHLRNYQNQNHEQNHEQNPEPDEEIKHILKNDLGTNTEDLETSINYNQEKVGAPTNQPDNKTENNNKYYEVFSNSVASDKKKEFFNNYLKL